MNVVEIGDAVWIAPERWRGRVSSMSEDGRLYLVTIDGQNRGRWCRAGVLTARDER